jgi:hypothetical protein
MSLAVFNPIIPDRDTRTWRARAPSTTPSGLLSEQSAIPLSRVVWRANGLHAAIAWPCDADPAVQRRLSGQVGSLMGRFDLCAVRMPSKISQDARIYGKSCRCPVIRAVGEAFRV